jgi:hypothetical protein
LGQADLMLKYTKHCADMKKEVDDAKEKLDLLKAEIEMDVRANPDKYNLAKPTEAGIQSTILLQEKYQEQSKKYSQARYEYDVSVGAVRAIDQKKTALENLVKLLAASYFAGPQSPRNLYQEQLDATKRKQANTKVKISPKRGK